LIVGIHGDEGCYVTVDAAVLLDVSAQRFLQVLSKLVIPVSAKRIKCNNRVREIFVFKLA